MNSIQLLCALGIFLSAYAFFIGRKVKSNPKYKPLCDISNKISCTKVLTSSYSKMFFIPNAILGIFYYAGMFILATSGNWLWAFILSLWGVIFSFVLGYYQYYKVKSFCLVCTATYLINFLLTILMVVETWL